MWMDLASIMLSEISQTEKANMLCYHLHVKSKKENKQMYTTKQKQIHRNREQTSGYQWGEGMGEGHVRDMGLRGTNYYV